MTEQAISPLRRRMIEDMTIRKFAQKTQYDYVRRVKEFASYLKRSPDTAKPEDVRGFQLHLTSSGAGTPQPVFDLLNERLGTIVNCRRRVCQPRRHRPRRTGGTASEAGKALMIILSPRDAPITAQTSTDSMKLIGDPFIVAGRTAMAPVRRYGSPPRIRQRASVSGRAIVYGCLEELSRRHRGGAHYRLD
jgi:Phage integrase, N-terminal SAM-like domain